MEAHSLSLLNMQSTVMVAEWKNRELSPVCDCTELYLWNISLLGKLIVIQLVKKFPALSCLEELATRPCPEPD
jgi:hypothetical protein